MNINLPLAIIVGMDNFLAVKLAEKLLEKGLRVYGFGDDRGKLEDKNYENFYELKTLREKAEYVFDFGGGEEYWREFEGSKLVIIGVNKRRDRSEIERRLLGQKVNYRVVNVMGVYGEGMDEDWWWPSWLRQAVENKNLMMSSRKSEVRLLEAEDGIEAIMRACFFSGTEGEVFEVWGKKYGMEEVAELLIDEAKMTRKKVVEGEEVMRAVVDEKVIGVWKNLRWEPEISLKKGIKGVLQYFFGKIDEEKRNKGKKKKVENKKPETVKTREEKRKAFEVIVEEARGEEVVEIEEEIKPEPVKMEVEVEKEVIMEKEEIKIEEVVETPKEEILEEEKEVEEEMEIGPIIKKANNIPIKEEINQEKEEEILEVAENDEDYEQKIEKPKLLAEKPKKRRKKFGFKNLGWKKSLWLLTGLSLVMMVGYWVWEGAMVVRGIKKGGELLMSQEYEKAREMINKERIRVEKIEKDLSDWKLNSLAIGRNYQSILRVEKEVLDLEGVGVETVEMADKLYGGVFNGDEVNWGELEANLSGNLVKIESASGVLEARLGGDWSWLPGKWRGDMAKLKEKIAESRSYVEMARKVLEIWPEMSGSEGGKRDYLVLFQNENEIRPTGGFIGSYGILSFENGVLNNMEIKDIYEIDGQLKGHVEPPEEIKDILGEASYYMRDANWQADFVKASKDLQWFFDKEAGRKVDGVIGINLAVAKELVGVVGEVLVPDFDEKITKDNLYEQAEFYSETKFFPGSNQKASFLGGLGKQLFEEIKSLGPEKRVDLLVKTMDLLEKNEIQISLNDKTAARVVAELGWDGSIWEGECAGERCVADYVFMVEANLGVNKANYFMLKNVEEEIEIGLNSIARRLRINYENTAKNSSWPGGDYKNYLRIYLPKEVSLAEVSVSKEGGEGKKVYSGSELKIRDVGDKKEVGFLVTVPVLEKREVELKYSSSIKIGEGEKFSYLNYIQKQSGWGNVSWVSLVSIPQNWQILQVEPVATVVGGKLLFNQKVDRDIKMGVEIGK